MVDDPPVLAPDAFTHHDRFVRGTPHQVFAAIFSLTPDEVRVSRFLMALRSLPMRLTGRDAANHDTLMEGLAAMGFVVLTHRPPVEASFGLVGKFWRPTGGVRRVDSADAFLAFAQPGFAKAMLSIRVEPATDGSRIVTDTIVTTTSAAARRRFRWYWRLVHPGGALVRRDWLSAIARRVERTNQETTHA